MRSRRLWLFILLCTLIFSAPERAFVANGEDLQSLVNRAIHTRDPVAWATYLIQADAAAEKLELHQPSGCCGYRCLRVESFELHFRYNDIDGRENYQHDLLQLVAQVHQGTRDGAEALARLLPSGCQTIASVWTPYFKTVLGILELKQWRDISDPRLTPIRAEAYETWWSLSRATSDDALITDQGLNPGDFVEGAAQARKRAIQAYQEILKSGHSDAAIANRIRQLAAGQDTQQRRWFCAGD